MTIEQFILRSTNNIVSYFPASGTGYLSLNLAFEHGAELCDKILTSFPKLWLTQIPKHQLAGILAFQIWLLESKHDFIEREILLPTEAYVIWQNLNLETNLSILNKRKKSGEIKLLKRGVKILSKMGKLLNSITHPLAIALDLSLRTDGLKSSDEEKEFIKRELIEDIYFNTCETKLNDEQKEVYFAIKNSGIEKSEDLYLVARMFFNPVPDADDLMGDIGLEDAIRVSRKFLRSLEERKNGLLNFLKSGESVQSLKNEFKLPSSSTLGLLGKRYFGDLSIYGDGKLRRNYLSLYKSLYSIDDEISTRIIDLTANFMLLHFLLHYDEKILDTLIRLLENKYKHLTLELEKLLRTYSNFIDVIDLGKFKVISALPLSDLRCASVVFQCITSLKFRMLGGKFVCPFNFKGCPILMGKSKEIFSCIKEVKERTPGIYEI